MPVLLVLLGGLVGGIITALPDDAGFGVIIGMIFTAGAVFIHGWYKIHNNDDS